MSASILNRMVLGAMVVVALGCKTKKVVVVPPVTAPVETVKDEKPEHVKLLRSKDINFNTLSLKGKANFDLNGNVNNVSINIHIKRDQKIWLSITAIAGIEVARAMITPDSILVLNRLQGNYVAKPFSYLYNFSNKQISFKMLQSILTGNTIGDLMTEPFALDQANGVWILTGEHAPVGFRVLFNTLLKPAETNLNDVKSGQALKVVYDSYQQVNDALFPSVLKISSMAGSKRTGIELEFSKIESNVPFDFPFSVPKRYQRID